MGATVGAADGDDDGNADSISIWDVKEAKCKACAIFA